jgi:transcription antitermination factor NusG
VPDKQMRDFMFLLNFADTTIKIENVEDTKKWDRVRVTKGEFAGIEGELIRIKGHKRVVVKMEGLFSLATSYIPKEYIEKISEI